MALGEYDWDYPTVDKYGRQVDYNKYKGPQDYLSSPYLGKYQQGGLIYIPYSNEDVEPVTFADYDRFPVKPVSVITAPVVAKPAAVEEPVEETTDSTPTVTQTVQPSPVVPQETMVQPVTQTGWSEKDLEILNKDGSNKDKQRVSSKYLQEQLGLTREQAAALVGI